MGMKPGRKPTTNASKALNGTLKPSRERHEIVVAEGAGELIMPAYLTPAAQEVWTEEVTRVTRVGATGLDTSLFARYCSLEAISRAIFATGDAPKAATIAELRRMGELLGLSGPSSRVQAPIKAEAIPTNPFAKLALATSK